MSDKPKCDKCNDTVPADAKPDGGGGDRSGECGDCCGRDERCSLDPDNECLIIEHQRDELVHLRRELEQANERLDWTRQELAGTSDTLTAVCEYTHAVEAELNEANGRVRGLQDGIAAEIKMRDQAETGEYEANEAAKYLRNERDTVRADLATATARIEKLE